MALHPTDAGLGVEFFIDAVENAAQTRAQGRPIYEDREFVRIAFPGDTKRELVAPAHEMHFVSHARTQMTYAQRFQETYRAFKEGLGGEVVGSPLALVDFVSTSRRKELEALKIKTVEQLASIPDTLLRSLGMNGRDLRDKASAWLAERAATVDTEALRREIAELRAQLSAGRAEPQTDAFDGFTRDDLFAMATDAGLNPRANASRDSLVAQLQEAAAKKVAA